MNILKYKDYEGTAEIDMDRQVCRGKILFINDLVTYEASSPKNLQAEFEAAVDDYIETCAELGRDAQKPLKGQFNVRISPALHKAASLRALQDVVSLNDVVVKSLDSYLNTSTNVNHNFRVTVDIPDEKMTGMFTGFNTDPKWEVVRAH
ncbi:MAG: type II toxin-antitoxin system HicB family antitoxin [Methylobacter sp.]